MAPTQQDICFCWLCKSDITAYALNRLPARYVSTHEGEQNFTSLGMDEQVHKVVVEASKRISKYPHREDRTMMEYTVHELFDQMDKFEESK